MSPMYAYLKYKFPTGTVEQRLFHNGSVLVPLTI
jgi:hypothetical protein